VGNLVAPVGSVRRVMRVYTDNVIVHAHCPWKISTFRHILPGARAAP
jgi:hypothetical protein